MDGSPKRLADGDIAQRVAAEVRRIGRRVDNQPTVYVINLRRDTDRWSRLSARLGQMDFQVVRVSAVDARSKFQLIARSLKAACFSTTLQRQLTAGECCCVLSHIAALRRIIRSDLPWAIVLEDDALLDLDFSRFASSDLLRYLHRVDIVKLEGSIDDPYVSKRGPIIASGAFSELILPFRPTLNSAAYAVTRAGALGLIAAFSTLGDPADMLLAYYERHGISYGETRPLFVTQDGSASSIARERNVAKTAFQFRKRVAKGMKIFLRTICFLRITLGHWVRSWKLSGDAENG